MASQDQHRDSSQRTAVVVCLLLAALHLLRFADLDHAVDDAWISFRVARTWLEQGVLTFDASRPPVEGMTNLLWTLLSALWIGLLPSVDPILPARLVGGGLHLLTVAMAISLAGRRAGSRAAWVTGLLLAATGSLAYYAVAGLETALWIALFLVSLDRLDRDRPAQAGLALGLLAMTRPEGVLVGALLCAAGMRRSWRTGAVFVLVVAGMEAFRWSTYGALVPNTFHAKAPVPTDGLAYVGTFLLYGVGILGPLAALPALRLPAGRVLGLLTLVLVAGVLWSGGDWMPGFRRLSLPLVVLALLAGAGAGLARTRTARAMVGAGVAAWLIAALVAGLSGRDHGRFHHDILSDLGHRAAATPDVHSVALVDIGRFGWAFPGTVIDLVGLTDAHLAHLPGGHADKPWDEQWFRAAAPDLLIARSSSPIRDPLPTQPVLGRPEIGMVRSVLDNGGYRLRAVLQPAEGQWLMVFGRDGVDLPLAIWGPQWEKDLPVLLGELALSSDAP